MSLGGEEKGSKTEWTIEQTKDMLLKSAQKKLEAEINFPDKIVLNETWMQVMEGVFHQSKIERGDVEFMFTHPEENGRIIKTDGKRQNCKYSRVKRSCGNTGNSYSTRSNGWRYSQTPRGCTI